MAYSFGGIENSIKDILSEETEQLKKELAQPALSAIQSAQENLHTAYVSQLMSTSVMNQMAIRAVQTRELDEMYQRVQALKAIAVPYHQQNLRFRKNNMRNEAIVEKADKQLEEYHNARDEYKRMLNEREKVFGVQQDRDMLQQPMIQAVQAIEQARDVFQKPVLYKIGLYSEANPGIINEVEMTFEQLIENNMISVKSKQSDNLLNTVSLSMSINKDEAPNLLRKMQAQQKLTQLDGADADYILQGLIGGEKYDAKVNRGWRYQYYLEGKAGKLDNKQDNKTWSAGPDVYSSGKYNYQAKFLAEGNTLQISSLVSLFGSLEAYEYKLQRVLNLPTKISEINMSGQIEQFEKNIVDSLTKKGLDIDLILKL